MTRRRSRFDIRRRLDASALRWQARLDTPWADRTLPWILGGALAVLLAAIGFAMQRQLDGGPTLAVWTQAAWNLEHGRGASSSLAGGNLVTDQWAFTTLPLLVLGRWVPLGAVLALAQPICVGLAVVPIWRMAREVARLRLGATTALCLAFGGGPILYTANLTGWSAVVPAVPAIAWAAWYGQNRRWLLYGLCVAFALLSRADVGLLLVALGILGVSSGDRRSGAITAAVGLAWTIAFAIAVHPEVPDAPLTAGEAVLARGVAPVAVLQEPWRIATDLVLQPNVGALVLLVGPFLFLPLVVPRFALPAFPPLVLGLVGEEAVRQQAEASVGAATLPSVLLLAVAPMALATIVALSRIGQTSVNRIRVDHRIVAAMVLATVAFFVQAAPASPFNEPWSWGGRDHVDGARMAAADLLDADHGDGPLAVSPQLAAQVAQRRVVEEIPAGPPEGRWEPAVDAVFLDTTAIGDDGRPLWSEVDHDLMIESLTDQGFDVAYDEAGVLLLLR